LNLELWHRVCLDREVESWDVATGNLNPIVRA